MFLLFIVKHFSPILDIDEYKNENIPSERQMNYDLNKNHDAIINFISYVKFLKNNQKFLETNPLTNLEGKMKKIQQNELKTIDLEEKNTKVTDDIDNLLQNYNETINIINKKFALYNQLLEKK